MNYNLELNQLFKEWESESKSLGLNQFCRDGLMYKGETWQKFQNDFSYYGRYEGNENELWDNSLNKIMFLLKDTNNNPNQDYREWMGRQNNSEISHKFFKNIALCLFGIFNINKDGTFPSFEVANNNYNLTKIFDEKPFAIVNCKKESGSGSIRNNELIQYVNIFGKFLKREIDILNPNIIVCGGSGIILEIIKQRIYPEIEFIKINSWVHYNKIKDLVLIDSYHPSARISYKKNYDGIMNAYIDFLKKKTNMIVINIDKQYHD